MRPKKYVTSSGEVIVTADDNKAFVEGTKGVISAKYFPPLVLEHPPKGDEKFSPQSPEARRSKKARELLGTQGWLKDIALNDDGSMEYTLDIPNKDIYEKVQRGEIKFTSPELRTAPWTDGQGKTHERFIYNVALTNRPVDIEQTALTEVQQFSVSDFDSIQLSDFGDDEEADDDGDGIPNKDDAEPENKDMPETGNPSEKEALMQAVIAQLEEQGFAMVSNVTEENFLEHLLTSMKTKAAADAKAAADSAEDDLDEDDPDQANVGPQQPMQFSLSDVQSKKFTGPKLLQKVINQEHSRLTADIDSLVESFRVTPATRDKLLGNKSAMQFSADGDSAISYTVPEVIELLRLNSYDGMTLGGFDAEQFSTQEHPQGDAFLSTQPGAEPTAAQVKAATEAAIKANPGIYKQVTK